ncbi:hypothetical protein ACFLSS_03865 [Bacteroidota bacterium]
MKNSITCPSCSHQNSFYAYTCKNCRSFLRDKIFNIDLWDVIGTLVETPGKAFKQIIFADHKNFIFFIWVFIAAKMLVNIRFVSLLSIGEIITTTSVYVSYIIVFSVFIIYIHLFSFSSKLINNALNIDTRFRDTLAIISFSLLPNIAGIVFIFILELVVFGPYLFSVNPTPFEIKGLAAYFFAGAELLLIIWSFILSLSALKVQTNSWTYSIITTTIFYSVLALIIYFSSKILFII